MSKKFFFTLGLLLFIGLGLATLGLVSTEAGLRVAWRIAVPLVQRLADIDMQAKRIGGRLLGPVEVEGFHYRDPWISVAVDRGQIDWQPLELLALRVQIDNFSAHQVAVTLQSNDRVDTADSDGPALLPITVHIENADISKVDFQLSPSSETWHFSAAKTRVRVLQDRVAIEQLTTEAYGIKGTADGFISWQGQFPFALNAQLVQPVPSGEALQSQIVAAGDLNDFRLRLVTQAPYAGDLAMQWQTVGEGYAIEAAGAVEPAPMLVALDYLPPEALATGPLNVDAQGILSATGFAANRLQIRHRESQLNAQGNIHWDTDEPYWEAKADWQDLALPPWQPAVFSAQGRADVTASLVQGEASVDAAYSVEAQKPGRVKLLLDWKSGQVVLYNGELVTGKSQINANGRVWPRAEVKWNVTSPDLAALWPTASGALNGEGEINGDWQAPRVLARLQGRKLGFDAYQLDRLDLQADIDLEQDNQGSLTLKATGLRLPEAKPANLQINVKGRRSDHRLIASLQSAQLSGSAEAEGGWAGGNAAWLGHLQALSLKPDATDRWDLVTPAALQLHSEQISLAETCLKQGSARFCLQGQSQGEGLAAQWQGDAHLKQLPLALLSTWLPSSLQLQGSANARASISGTGKQWLTANINGDASAELSRESIEDKLRLSLPTLTLVASPEQWQGKLALRINDVGKLDVEGTAMGQPQAWQAAPLRGNINVDLPNLQAIALIAPEIEQLRGQLAGTIMVAGSLGTPVFEGRLALEKGRLELRDYGISLSPLTASIRGASNGMLDVAIEATSGGGSLRAQGQVKPDLKQPSLNMTVKGERFLASRTDEAMLYASPDLKLKLQDKQLELTGELGIPEALLQPGTQEASAQTVSGDQILVNDQQIATKEPGWKLLARVRLILGEKVRFQGMGIETRLAGQIDIRENPGKPTIANGEIRLVDGSYEVYGQKLDIDTGRLIFANAPVTEPAIDLKASRVPRPDIKVGVRVRGLLDAPTVTLFSKPSMRQAEQLSYLILGRPLEGNEGNPTLATAALALGLNRGDKYIKGLSDTFNVDQIGIETTPGQSADQASLVVGKYLSPRLYVSYGAGLFENLHKLRMRYRLSEHWTLTGESGTTQGADILYTIER